MYRTAYQRGMISVLFSGGSQPLGIWEITKSKDGYIDRFLDNDIKAMVIEIGGNNVSTTYVSCPPGKQVLGISMPFLVMIVKNLKKYFVFEITILDETGTRRRFRIANFQSTTQIGPLCTAMPLQLSDGWNQIQFNLAEFTRRAYNKQYIELQKIRINANIRIRRIYCAERLMTEEELPPEYKLYFPITSKKKDKGKENRQQQTSEGEKRKIESKLDVKVVKSDKDLGTQVNLAAASAPSEGVTAEGATAKPVATEEEPTVKTPTEGVPAESTTVDKLIVDKETPADATLVEGEPGEEILTGEIEKGETVLANETPVGEAAEVQTLPEGEAAEVQTLPEGEAPVVEELAGEVPVVEAEAMDGAY